VDVSSEDPGYPADELNVHSPNTRGWQSAKFSEYPQEIGLALDGGEARLTQVQILSHQSKIASKVEIFIGTGSSYRTAEFKRLGYLSLDSNERSQYVFWYTIVLPFFLVVMSLSVCLSSIYCCLLVCILC
jgi:centrosomal protein CEP104